MNPPRFTIADLANIIVSRSKEPVDSPIYVSSWVIGELLKGPDYLGRKVVEESAEVLAEAVRSSRNTKQKKSRLTEELSDLIFYALILATSEDISLTDIEGVLANRHDKDRYLDSARLDAHRLQPYASKRPAFDLNGLLRHYKMSFPRTADIVLVSHRVRKKRHPDAAQICRFSEHAKALKVKLTSEKLKVKLAVPRGKNEVFESRRGTSLTLPIVVVLSSVALPLCINILAAYVKDWLDAQDDTAKETDLQIDITVRKTGKKKETWYEIKGKPAEVYRALRKLQGKPSRQTRQNRKSLTTK